MTHEECVDRWMQRAYASPADRKRIIERDMVRLGGRGPGSLDPQGWLRSGGGWGLRSGGSWGHGPLDPQGWLRSGGGRLCGVGVVGGSRGSVRHSVTREKNHFCPPPPQGIPRDGSGIWSGGDAGGGVQGQRGSLCDIRRNNFCPPPVRDSSGPAEDTPDGAASLAIKLLVP